MRRSRRVTIKEVAAAAGVSTQTVSRVLNDRPDVAPETFERVSEVIEQLGYAPNVLARGLIQGRSNTLGVVAYGLEYVGPSRMLTGIEQQANALGFSILLNLVHQQLLRHLLARQVDGIIWAIPEIGANRAWTHEKSVSYPIPLVFVSGMDEQRVLPIVAIDNRQIGRLATSHLLDGGVRRVGIVTGPLSWWEARERREGWREALSARGLPPDDRLVVEGDWSAGSGENGLYRLLAQCPDIDAVFACNDQMALGVLHAAHRLGRRVPDDFSVVGVDNIPESAYFWPALTTVRQRLREAGGQAVLELDRMLKVGQSRHSHAAAPPANIWLQPELIVRGSSRVTASQPLAPPLDAASAGQRVAG